MAGDFIPVAQPSLSMVERDFLLRAFDSSWISSSGEFLQAFENRFAALCGTRHALAVANGTVALHLALAGLGIGPGDEVIVPSLTYVATANAVRYCGGEPVFADVREDDWGLDSASVASLVGPRTRAVIAVHLYGHPADMTSLRALCDARGLALVEDAAEAPFAFREGQSVGSMGDVATFSFYGNKVITCGEGGAVTTNDDELVARLRMLRGQGMDPQRRYWFPVVGHNFRLTNLAAAILCGQLDRLDVILGRRCEIFAEYADRLSLIPGVETQPVLPGVRLTPWLYCILLRDQEARSSVVNSLHRWNVDSRPFFIPLHTMPPYAQSRTAGQLRVTIDLASRGLNLPTFPEMSSGDIGRVVNAVRAGLNAT
jgi:perosamine synthetase